MSDGRRAERLYRSLLRVLPSDFRREAEPEMLELFRLSRAACRSSLKARVLFWPRTALDLLWTAIVERVSMAREERQTRSVGNGIQPGVRRASGAPQSDVRSAGSALRLDVRSALRDLRRRPGLSLLASFTLGVGLAATLLMLILVRDVLERPLPFEQPERLVRLLERSEAGAMFWPSFPNIADWRESATVLEAVVAADVGTVKPVLTAGAAYRVGIGNVSRGFFETLGVRPVRGRTFGDDENRPGAPPVALIGHEFWSGPLAGAPLDGLTLEVGADTYRVIGVLPRGFRFLGNGNAWLDAGVWLPLERAPDLGARSSHGYHTVARLRPGVDIVAARRAMTELAERFKAEYGESTQADDVVVQPLDEAVLGAARRPLALLLLGSLIVLVVACLNLGASLLARGIARRQELSIRAALGGRRADLIRLQLVHAAVLAIPGGLVGALAAWLALRTIRALAPDALPRLHDVAMNPAALAIAGGLALVTAIIAGLLPAIVLSMRGVARAIRTHGSRTTSTGQSLLWDGFVAGQAALTLVLLATSALLLDSLRGALSYDVGYDARDVVIADIALPETRYQDAQRRVLFYEGVLAQLRAAPGVATAGLVSTPPDEVFTMVGVAHREGDEATNMWSGYRLADDGYFETLRIPTSGQLDGTGDGVLIDRHLADGLWEDDRAVASGRVRMGGPPMTVTGTVGAVQMWNQTTEVGAIYEDFRRVPDRLLAMYIVARGPDERTVSAALRAAVEATDPLVPIEVERLGARLQRAMADRRLMLAIAIAFAAIALLLAVAGIHALVAHTVARRQRENGIRLILGAQPTQLRRRVLTIGLRGTLVGVAAGVPLTLAAASLIRARLDGVGVDASAIGAAVVLLLVAASAAAWWPARHAVRADPARLMREE